MGHQKAVGLSVIDNGKGFDPQDLRTHQQGLGLSSMEERLRQLHGFFRIQSRPSYGTKVCAWVPCEVEVDMKQPRILMADDHAIVLAGLRKLVEAEGEVVGMVEDGRSLVDAAQQLRPDIVLLDISMPLLNGLDAARQISKLVPESKLIFLTMHATPTYATEAFKAGASGYLIKRSAAAELKQAIEAVMRGQHYMTPLITKDVLAATLQSPEDQPSKPLVTHLTQRQREVLQLVAEGKGTKAIASILNISVKTVEFHKFRIMGELDLHSTAELIKYAIAEGLVSVSS